MMTLENNLLELGIALWMCATGMAIVLTSLRRHAPAGPPQYVEIALDRWHGSR